MARHPRVFTVSVAAREPAGREQVEDEATSSYVSGRLHFETTNALQPTQRNGPTNVKAGSQDDHLACSVANRRIARRVEVRRSDEIGDRAAVWAERR